MAAEAPVEVKKMAAKLTAADIAVMAANSGPGARPVSRGDAYRDILKPDKRWVCDWGRSFIRQINPIFCVPGNTRMLDYWTRVEDRLFKLRHCQDIDGTFRLLPLFAPEIDPALLVGGVAAGVSLEDLLGSGTGSLPPYRFRYLVDKAKAMPRRCRASDRRCWPRSRSAMARSSPACATFIRKISCRSRPTPRPTSSRSPSRAPRSFSSGARGRSGRRWFSMSSITRPSARSR